MMVHQPIVNPVIFLVRHALAEHQLTVLHAIQQIIELVLHLKISVFVQVDIIRLYRLFAHYVIIHARLALEGLLYNAQHVLREFLDPINLLRLNRAHAKMVTSI